ncbi:PREDICTED: activating signal cointegrator 1 complex subunit 2 [Eufriesea mexicana]|uniref:activating signal cointegrator 1 complex subunit 2 n=1 Tax=Eufriesea mexicana TaxID=516756 RepID=UPI00083C2DDE|nr:PREDICTED: activating signal cointegrator 1 complex subunit 2 [Eufriesea mexicana]
MELYENPELLPLEELKLKIKTGGVIEDVEALSKRWASDHYFLSYEAPDIYNDDGFEITGAKQRWMEIVNYMINDLKWLLGLPFYKFWSNIVFNTSILDTLVSFLQEAPPFYALENFPNSPEMLELLETLSRYVLVVFTRLVTNKESSKEFMNRPFFGNLLYEKYIFTVPIIFDLCQLYGRDNGKVIKRILNCLFTLEPRYYNDLQRAVPYLVEVLENVEAQFDGYSTHTNETVSLSKQNTNSTKITLVHLEDMILCVLDISSTINVFLKNYHVAISIFHKKDFMNKLVLVYENTIPEMYKILDNLANNDENMPKYVQLKHRLDVIRIEIINLFRIIIYEPVSNIQENLNSIKEAELKERVDEYLNLLINVISEKEFITDYVQFYPIELDLIVFSQICPDFDTIKYDYIMQSVNAIIGNPGTPSTSFSNNVNEATAGPSGISNQTATSKNVDSSNKNQISMMKNSVEFAGPSGINQTATSKNIDSTNKNQISVMKNSVEFASLVSEVKDILYDLDEHFIEISLEYYNYDTAAVINAVLENSLPQKLKELKELGPSQIPSATPIYTEVSVNENSMVDSHNDNDNDDNDDDENDDDDDDDDDDDVYVKTEETIPIATDYIIKNYSLVADVYNDEYDDTYDNRDIRGNTHDNSTEIDSRPFTIPRVLREKQKIEVVSDSESENEDVGNDQNGKDCFVQNPEEIRARAEQRRQMRGGKVASNVIGKPKGQGQEKDVLYNRQQKNTKKAKRANHNRRSGAQWKRNQGMVSS